MQAKEVYFINNAASGGAAVKNEAKTVELELTEPILLDELVERCKQGDNRSFAELYSKYAKAMYNTSLRIVNHTGDAEDVLQEAFTDAFRSLEDFHYKSTFGAWLKRIVINKSINLLRKTKDGPDRHRKDQYRPPPR